MFWWNRIASNFDAGIRTNPESGKASQLGGNRCMGYQYSAGWHRSPCRQRYSCPRCTRVRGEMRIVSWRKWQRWSECEADRQRSDQRHGIGEDHRQLLAVRDDALRLHPPRNAMATATLAHQR